MGEGRDRTQVATSPEAVWKVIADIEGHARLAGSSEILAIRFQGPLRVGARWEADEPIKGLGRFTADHYHDIAAHLGWWRLGNALTGAGALLALAGVVGVCRALSDAAAGPPGFGRSAPREREDFQVDAADIAEVLGDGACWGDIVSRAWVPITVLVPHALLPFSMDEVGQLTAVRVPGRRGVGGLVSRFLMQSARHVDQYQAPDAMRLPKSAPDVPAALLAHQLDRRPAAPLQTHRQALLQRIHVFIDQHLGDPELSPGMVATANHISVRYLHKLFQKHDMTVAAWIRSRRLDRCRRDLADPGLWARPVSAIGARWGFPDGAHFSRVFRAAYGVPPREYRRRAARARAVNH